MGKLTTWSGRQVDPLDLLPDDVDIDDIAQSLSMLCRFNGHCARFYSVAEHSVLVSRLCPPAFALAGLLHDASEAYLADLPRPLKALLPDYIAAEEQAQIAIAGHFNLPDIMGREVRRADDAALALEVAALLTPFGIGGSSIDDILCLPPDLAKDLFFRRYYELAV